MTQLEEYLSEPRRITKVILENKEDSRKAIVLAYLKVSKDFVLRVFHNGSFSSCILLERSEVEDIVKNLTTFLEKIKGDKQ